jgi:hypothetical protein
MRPPKTKRKLGAEARAELGQARTCKACDETKEVSEKTFTPKNTGVRGWGTICKVCESHGRSEKDNDSVIAQNLRPGTGDQMITYMYTEAMRPKPDQAKLDEVISILGSDVRKLAEEDPEKSFRLFIDIIKPLIAGWMEPGPIHDDIIAGLISTHRRRLVIATRYSAKSTITSIYIAWRIFLNPLIKIMVVSRGSKLAARMLRTVRQIYLANCPMLSELVPTEDCLDNAEQFQTPQTLQVTTGGASLTSLGITSNLPGFRADLTVGDDVEGPQEDSPEKVEALEEILNELHMINPKGEKVMLGTYQSEISIYGKLAQLLDRDDVPVWEEHRACMFEDDGELITSRWPGMFTDDDAMDWRKSVTERAWKLHAMLICDPSILNERPLKISNFILHKWSPKNDKFPEYIEAGGEHAAEMSTWGAPPGDAWYRERSVGTSLREYVTTVMAVDPASGLASRDAIGVAVLSVTSSGHGVIRHLEGVRGPEKLGNIQRVAEIAKLYAVDKLVVEELADGLFGETLENQLLTLGYHIQAEKITTGGMQKGRRIIETLAPPMANGRLIMLEDVARSDSGGDFTNQLVRISYDGRTGKAKDHDDIVDALAHAVAQSGGSLVSDIGDNIASARAATLDKWSRVPTRQGGLGIEDESAHNVVMGARMAPGERNYAERLLEDDGQILRVQAKIENLVERAKGCTSATQRDSIMAQVSRLKTTLTELKELDVL